MINIFIKLIYIIPNEVQRVVYLGLHHVFIRRGAHGAVGVAGVGGAVQAQVVRYVLQIRHKHSLLNYQLFFHQLFLSVNNT